MAAVVVETGRPQNIAGGPPHIPSALAHPAGVCGPAINHGELV